MRTEWEPDQISAVWPPEATPEHPLADKQCDLCGEYLGDEDDIGEMYGQDRYRFGMAGNAIINYGLVHAQCGLDSKWGVA